MIGARAGADSVLADRTRSSGMESPLLGKPPDGDEDQASSIRGNLKASAHHFCADRLQPRNFAIGLAVFPVRRPVTSVIWSWMMYRGFVGKAEWAAGRGQVRAWAVPPPCRRTPGVGCGQRSTRSQAAPGAGRARCWDGHRTSRGCPDCSPRGCSASRPALGRWERVMDRRYRPAVMAYGARSGRGRSRRGGLIHAGQSESYR